MLRSERQISLKNSMGLLKDHINNQEKSTCGSLKFCDREKLGLLLLTSYVTLEQSLHFPGPQDHYLQNECLAKPPNFFLSYYYFYHDLLITLVYIKKKLKNPSEFLITMGQLLGKIQWHLLEMPRETLFMTS